MSQPPGCAPAGDRLLRLEAGLLARCSCDMCCAGAASGDEGPTCALREVGSCDSSASERGVSGTDRSRSEIADSDSDMRSVPVIRLSRRGAGVWLSRTASSAPLLAGASCPPPPATAARAVSRALRPDGESSLDDARVSAFESRECRPSFCSPAPPEEEFTWANPSDAVADTVAAGLPSPGAPPLSGAFSSARACAPAQRDTRQSAARTGRTPTPSTAAAGPLPQARREGGTLRAWQQLSLRSGGCRVLTLRVPPEPDREAAAARRLLPTLLRSAPGYGRAPGLGARAHASPRPA